MGGTKVSREIASLFLSPGPQYRRLRRSMPMVSMRVIMTFPMPKHTKKNLAVAISSSLTSAFLGGTTDVQETRELSSTRRIARRIFT